MTGEIPDRRCGVDGCDRPAVARLFDRGDAVGLRCRPCLLYDLDADGA